MKQLVKCGTHPLVVSSSVGFSNYRVFIWKGNGLFMINTLKESLSEKVQNYITKTSRSRERGFLSKI